MQLWNPQSKTHGRPSTAWVQELSGPLPGFVRSILTRMGAELFWEFFFGGGELFFSMVSIENGEVSGGSGPVTLSTAKKNCGLKCERLSL